MQAYDMTQHPCREPHMHAYNMVQHPENHVCKHMIGLSTQKTLDVNIYIGISSDLMRTTHTNGNCSGEYIYIAKVEQSWKRGLMHQPIRTKFIYSLAYYINTERHDLEDQGSRIEDEIVHLTLPVHRRL